MVGKIRVSAVLIALLLPALACAHDDSANVPAISSGTASAAANQGRQWLPGDHHVHSEFSVGYKADPLDPRAPPIPILGGDGRYPIRRNAEMARSFGLKWMVSTDHGGPNHSRIRHDVAYPVLLESRQQVPEVLQFFGMELDAPAGDHGSLIIPRSDGERAQLRDIEFGFSRKDVFPPDPARD